jgi:hypothetical protein
MPERARKLLSLAEQDVRERWKLYERLAALGPEAAKPTREKAKT